MKDGQDFAFYLLLFATRLFSRCFAYDEADEQCSSEQLHLPRENVDNPAGTGLFKTLSAERACATGGGR